MVDTTGMENGLWTRETSFQFFMVDTQAEAEGYRGSKPSTFNSLWLILRKYKEELDLYITFNSLWLIRERCLLQ